MIDLKEAAQRVGDAVVYRPSHGNVEQGYITSANDRYVFVRYGSQGGSAATDPADLEWLPPPLPPSQGSAAEGTPDGVGQCDAKIRPFPDGTEVVCERSASPHDEHEGVIRDKAYPGSETRLTWWESDRRTFRGKWQRCDRHPGGCVLPHSHRGSHAQ